MIQHRYKGAAISSTGAAPSTPINSNNGLKPVVSSINDQRMILVKLIAKHKLLDTPSSLSYIQFHDTDQDFSGTALEASRWLRRQVPRRYSGSSTSVFACIKNAISITKLLR